MFTPEYVTMLVALELATYVLLAVALDDICATFIDPVVLAVTPAVVLDELTEDAPAVADVPDTTFNVDVLKILFTVIFLLLQNFIP